MSNELTWTEETVLVCDCCEKPMIPNISTWDEEDGGGCGWSCTTYDCSDFTGDEIETEDLEALGVPYWIAERMAGLANAYAMKEMEN